LVFNDKDIRVASSAFPLANMSLFAFVNNIEYYPYCGSKIARSAGTSAIVTTKFADNSLLKLKSGWNLKISKTVFVLMV
jgi:ribosomal protein L2